MTNILWLIRKKDKHTRNSHEKKKEKHSTLKLVGPNFIGLDPIVVLEIC